MVKPALPYLDIVRAVADEVDGSRCGVPGLGRVRDDRGGRGAGWIDRERAVLETLTSIRRAGASVDPDLLRARGGPRCSA